MDTAQLAKTLGISQTAVRNRAEKLGITPQETTQGRGRPKQIWTQEQVEAIENFGNVQTDNTPQAENWQQDNEQAGVLAIAQAGQFALVHSQALLGSLDRQCEAIELATARAGAARIAVMQARSVQLMNQMLAVTPIGIDFAEFAPQVITPIARLTAGDRFPEFLE